MKLTVGRHGGTFHVDSNNIIYEYGTWVMYRSCPEAEWELGRVVDDAGEAAYVCYSNGCTAALTPKWMLRPATESEIDSYLATQRHGVPGIGYYRFEDSCPDMVPEACMSCIHHKPDPLIEMDKEQYNA